MLQPKAIQEIAQRSTNTHRDGQHFQKRSEEQQNNPSFFRPQHLADTHFLSSSFGHVSGPPKQAITMARKAMKPKIATRSKITWCVAANCSSKKSYLKE